LKSPVRETPAAPATNVTGADSRSKSQSP
jgi:hypothetical protein